MITMKGWKCRPPTWLTLVWDGWVSFSFPVMFGTALVLKFSVLLGGSSPGLLTKEPMLS